MLICFLWHYGELGSRWSHYYYKQVVESLRRGRRKRLQLWEKWSHPSSGQRPSTLSTLGAHWSRFWLRNMSQYMTIHIIHLIEHFFLFPAIKSALKGTRFRSVPEVKKKTTELLRQLTALRWSVEDQNAAVCRCRRGKELKCKIPSVKLN